MIKVMIVDDEYLIRIGLKSTIQWEDQGFEIIGDAENGEKALEMYHEFHPDIVITDIKMPRMDGIELTKRLKSINPLVKIVILSSHNDFIYAKEALKLGASDYILKATMEPSEIIKTLNSLKVQIENREIQVNEIDSLRDELQLHKKHSKLKFFKEWVNGLLIPEQNNANFMKEQGVSFSYLDFVVLCGRIDDYEEQYLKVKPKTKRLLKDSIINILLSKMTDVYKGEVAELTDGVFVIILAVDFSKYSCEDAGLIYGTAVQEALKTYTRITMSLSISKRVTEFNQIPSVTQEVLQALQYRVFLGRNCVITNKDCGEFIADGDVCFSCEEDKIRYFVLNGQYEPVEKVVTEIFNHISKGTRPLKHLKYTCTQLVSLLNRIAIEVGFSREMDKIYFTIEEPMGLESVIEIEVWFQYHFKLLAQSIGMTNCQCNSGSIREAIKFIRSEYMRNISLGDVAEHVNISRVYFSQLFKQETNEKYIDFLNHVRIEKAKEYLTFNDLRTYEVAEKVGFQDPGYFAKTFKRIEGRTPSEFRKSLL